MRDLRKILVIALIAAALTLLAGCSGGSTPAPSGGTGSPGSGSSGGTPSSSVAVSMQNFAFSPSDITVAVGGTVTFTNNDSTAHDVAGGSWDSGSLAPGATFSQTFTAAGTVPIRCTIHPSMTGTITVK